MRAIRSCHRPSAERGRLCALPGDDWLSTADLSITAALEAAAPNTRIAWACDWAVFRTWALGRAAVWYPDERDRIRLPTRPELLVRFVTDMLGGYDGDLALTVASIGRK